jgi:glycosyltransferase involved in cell wall biosynthesis
VRNGNVTIGVNGRRLVGQRLGIGRYIEYLLRHWNGMLDDSERVELYVEEPFSTDALGLSDQFSSKVLRPKVHGFVWENVVLPRGARTSDVLFAPSYMLPATYRGKSVVAIHSMNEVWPGTHPWWYRFTYSPVYRMSAERADRVIVPSHSTLVDIQEYYGIPEEKIRVVPEGADDSFRRLDDDDLARETRLRWLGADRPFIVFVGKLSQRRNIPALIEAFADVKRRDGLPHALLLFGPNHLGLPIEEQARELGVADDVIQTDGRIADHSELVAVYNAADAYVSASSYEGFSLTMCEAMACGTPVIAVDRAAQREIIGDAGILVEDATPEALAAGIEGVLTSDATRADLSDRSVERAKLFRWEQTAQLTLDVIREVTAE